MIAGTKSLFLLNSKSENSWLDPSKPHSILSRKSNLFNLYQDQSFDYFLICAETASLYQIKSRHQLELQQTLLQKYFTKLRNLIIHGDLAAANVFICGDRTTLTRAAWIVDAFDEQKTKAPTCTNWASNSVNSFGALSDDPGFWRNCVAKASNSKLIDRSFSTINYVLDSRNIDAFEASQEPIAYWSTRPTPSFRATDKLLLRTNASPSTQASLGKKEYFFAGGAWSNRLISCNPSTWSSRLTAVPQCVLNVLKHALKVIAAVLEARFHNLRLQPVFRYFVVVNHDWLKTHGARPPRVLLKRLVSCFQQVTGRVHSPLPLKP